LGSHCLWMMMDWYKSAMHQWPAPCTSQRYPQHSSLHHPMPMAATVQPSTPCPLSMSP
jgi:hypothetical protein